MGIASEFETTILQHRLPALDAHLAGRGFVVPHYAGLSIANVAPTVAALLGRELKGAAPPLPHEAWADLGGGVRAVIVVVVDALGYRCVERMLGGPDEPLGELAHAGRLLPLTSVFPSTTMAAMATHWTGRTPAEHGFLGSRLFLSDYGVLANMIRLAPDVAGPYGSMLSWGWVPEEFLPVPAAAQLLAELGVETVAHLYAPHVGGGLARLFLRGVSRVEGFVAHADAWINVRESVERRGTDPLVVNLYWAGTDDVAHMYGPHGEPFAGAVRDLIHSMQAHLIDRLSPAAREGTVLIVTADHGQVETPPETVVRLADHPVLEQMLLMPPAAETRAAYLYARPGQVEAVRGYVREHLADRFLVLDTDAALAAGLFGGQEISPALRPRLGDLLLLARGSNQFLARGEKAPYRGHHGSLTEEEMLVPFLMVRLDG